MIRYQLSADDWVVFKAFGLPILNLLFVASQYPLIARAEADWNARRHRFPG